VQWRMANWFAVLACGWVGIVGGGADVVSAEDWTEFRGPGQQGHSPERNLPVTWSDADGQTQNVRWKSELPGLGWSSASIANGQVWLTTAVDEGHSLRALCLDATTGAVVHNIEVFRKDEPGPIHQKNSHASPTPVIVDGHVYVHFGKHGTACLTTEGQIVWKTELAYNHRHGPGGSPVVAGDLLLINCDGTDVQYVVALHRETGEQVWKQLRNDAQGNPGRMAYSTPLLTEVNGQPQLISSGGEWTIAYAPQSGEELWRFQYPGGYSNVPRPVVGFDLVFVSSGYDSPVFYALKLGGKGTLTDDAVAWKVSKGAPRNASPILVGQEIYLVNDNGIVSCLDAVTGQQHWQERLGGDFSASPLMADGRLYLTNEEGVTKVLAPGTTFRELAENVVPGRTLASLAAADGALFLRTDSALYRLEQLAK
jgi:outer membrane protein assembly factor BamB